MLHLLHIPTGKVILFYDERHQTGRTWSVQELQEYRQEQGEPLEIPEFYAAINLELFPEEWIDAYHRIADDSDGQALKERLLSDTILVEIDT